MGELLAGDPSQLPPVQDKELISESTTDGPLDRGGRDLWRGVDHVIQLWRCHRQQGDAAYAAECLSLRNGTFNEATWTSWKNRDLMSGEPH